MTPRLLPVLLLLACGCDKTFRTRLDDAAGLTEGSPVLIAGARVGEVKAVRIAANQVEAEFSLAREHKVAFHEDACGIAVRQPQKDGKEEPVLMIMIGQSGTHDTSKPLSPCHVEQQAMKDLGGALGGILSGFLDPLRRQMGSAFPPILPLPNHSGVSITLPPPSGSPALPRRPLPIPSSDDKCAVIKFRVERVENLPPTPLFLPHGGYRVHLVAQNNGAEPMRIGSIHNATFLDQDRRVIIHATTSDPDGWFMPFTIPANASRPVTAVFPKQGDTPLALHGIEVSECSPETSPFDECSVHQSGL